MVSSQLPCPECGQTVVVSRATQEEVVSCPNCNAEFFASVSSLDLEIISDIQSPTVDVHPDIAFDRLRIEYYTALRMGAIRARSWLLITACMCALIFLDMSGKLILVVWDNQHWGLWPTLRLIAAISAIVTGQYAYRRANQFKKEITQSALPDPLAPPDFSTLSNGDDRWKLLENVR